LSAATPPVARPLHAKRRALNRLRTQPGFILRVFAPPPLSPCLLIDRRTIGLSLIKRNCRTLEALLSFFLDGIPSIRVEKSTGYSTIYRENR
jgi:hypothetical protein